MARFKGTVELLSPGRWLVIRPHWYAVLRAPLVVHFALLDGAEDDE